MVRERAKEEAKRAVVATKGTFDPTVLESETYAAWVENRVAAARASGLVVTQRQYADLTSRRDYKPGDRVRYVGPTRLEPSRSGANVPRPHGQPGTITKVARSAAGPVYTFMPDIDRETRAAADAGLRVEVLTLETARFLDFERVTDTDSDTDSAGDL
jgi:hypothetical protein